MIGNTLLSHVSMDIRNHRVYVQYQFSLNGDRWVRECSTEGIERTLKTWRILTRSCFQPAILSLLLFERINRVAAFRLPCLTTFLWISATVLRLRVSLSGSLRVASLAHIHSQIPNRIEDSLFEFVRSSPLQSPVQYLAYIAASPSKLGVVLIVGHRVLGGQKSEVDFAE